MGDEKPTIEDDDYDVQHDTPIGYQPPHEKLFLKTALTSAGAGIIAGSIFAFKYRGGNDKRILFLSSGLAIAAASLNLLTRMTMYDFSWQRKIFGFNDNEAERLGRKRNKITYGIAGIIGGGFAGTGWGITLTFITLGLISWKQ
jgi:hypothetical protein